MTTPVIVSGDDIALAVTLKKNSAVFVIDPTATVKARLISTDHSETYIAAVTQTEVAGTDWANSLVVVVFTSAVTDAITYQGAAVLEIEVDESGKTTFFAVVDIKTGTI